MFQRLRHYFSKRFKAAKVVPQTTETVQTAQQPQLNWIYQHPVKGSGVSYDQWRESNAGMPDTDDARQIFQKHQ